MHARWQLIGLSALLVSGCAMDAVSPDGVDEVGVIPGGKADGSDYSECELAAVVSWLNEGPSANDLRDAGVHTRAARNLVAAPRRRRRHLRHRRRRPLRRHPRGRRRLLRRPGRHPAARRRRRACAARRGRHAGRSSRRSPTIAATSPRSLELIDGAQRSIDIAMYSFSDSAIMDALSRALDRGVSIRVIYDGANADRARPDGTTSARLEDMGIEVRYVNKIMHHKFIIVDGAARARSSGHGGTSPPAAPTGRTAPAPATTRTPSSSTATRSSRSATSASTNCSGTNSRDFVWNEDIAARRALRRAGRQVADDPSVDAMFTSANFRTYDLVALRRDLQRRRAG